MAQRFVILLGALLLLALPLPTLQLQLTIIERGQRLTFAYNVPGSGRRGANITIEGGDQGLPRGRFDDGLCSHAIRASSKSEEQDDRQHAGGGEFQSDMTRPDQAAEL